MKIKLLLYDDGQNYDLFHFVAKLIQSTFEELQNSACFKNFTQIKAKCKNVLL